MKRLPQNLKGYASAYLERGFALLPLHSAVVRNGAIICACSRPDCAAAAKHPLAKLVPHGLKDASSNPAVVKGWFGGFATNNIGIATGAVSGIVVIDVDTRHGGNQSLRELETKHGALPTTLRWRTGGGGEHILFRHPGGTIRNSAGQLGAGLDVRGDGGYIVAPPSRHKSGNYYVLPDGQPFNTPLAQPPAWLLNLLRQGGTTASKHGGTPIGQVVQEQVPEGQRNTTIARVAGHLLAKRIDPRICLDLMLAFNATRCVPPLDEKEVARTVASIEHLSFTKLINKK
jgi:putative DNA primase/helicase